MFMNVNYLLCTDPVFLILYKELYFRHIYARIQSGPTQEQRFKSYYNYCDLFNYILSRYLQNFCMLLINTRFEIVF